MPTVHVNNFDEWRNKARELVINQVTPETIEWVDDTVAQQNLFASTADITHQPLTTVLPAFKIPRAFVSLAKHIACHRAPKKWQMLYFALWRLVHGEKHLMALSTDPLVRELMLMFKGVRRDMHKMKAFVRFRLYQRQAQQFYIAWHKPDHKILALICPFFQRRFAVLNWLIVTPDGAAYWDGQQLHLDETITALKEPLIDDVEDLWLTYYRAIFNPARIKLKAMRREMPVRYWETMPETKIITEMLLEAPQRVAAMLKHQEGIATSAADYLPENRELMMLKTAASNCQGCPLYREATQTVFGIGKVTAKVMLVGEQPGDQEDLSGEPFSGPAGQLLNDILQKAGIERDNLYITNAVKHFKFHRQHGRRLHVSPNIKEIHACKPWLSAEIEAIQPKLIVCLGLTAARALINPGFHMKQHRGHHFEFSATQMIMATYHPSAILRAIDDDQKQEIYDYLLTDLQRVFEFSHRE